jgi:predicted nucleic acid-binding protein
LSAFVDSSAFYAAADGSDASHERATGVLGAQERLITSDHVLVETWLLVNRWLGRAAAERLWDRLRAGAAIVEPVLGTDLDEAWQIGIAYPDQSFSIVDRTSFAVMRRLGLERVASFDDDFLIYRYGRDRRRAFAVLR